MKLSRRNFLVAAPAAAVAVATLPAVAATPTLVIRPDGGQLPNGTIIRFIDESGSISSPKDPDVIRQVYEYISNIKYQPIIKVTDGLSN